MLRDYKVSYRALALVLLATQAGADAQWSDANTHQSALERRGIVPPQPTEFMPSRPERPDRPNRLAFKAPQSQLFEAWRCTVVDPFGRAVATIPCPQDSRRPADFLEDPLIPLRFLTPLPSYPALKPPRATVRGAPSSQLPNY